MSKSDWYEAGEQIKNLVQDAIDHKDFSQLSNTITNVVNRTMDELQQSLKDSFEAMGKKEPGERQEPEKESFDHRAAAERIRRNMWEKQQAKKKRAGDEAGKVQTASGHCFRKCYGLDRVWHDLYVRPDSDYHRNGGLYYGDFRNGDGIRNPGAVFLP